MIQKFNISDKHKALQIKSDKGRQNDALIAKSKSSSPPLLVPDKIDMWSIWERNRDKKFLALMSSGLFLDLNLLFGKLLEWLKSNGINSYTNIMSLLHAKINGDKTPPMSKHYLFQDFLLWIRKCACQVSTFKFNTNTKKIIH